MMYAVIAMLAAIAIAGYVAWSRKNAEQYKIPAKKRASSDQTFKM